MSDSTISSTIESIHSIITTFFTILALLFSVFFFFLTDGIYIERIILPKIELQGLFLKLEDRLVLRVNKTHISTSSSRTTRAFDSKTIKQAMNTLQFTLNWFESIELTHLKIDENRVTFSMQDGFGVLALTNKKLRVHSQFHIANKRIVNDANITLKGYGRLHSQSLMNLQTAQLYSDNSLYIDGLTSSMHLYTFSSLQRTALSLKTPFTIQDTHAITAKLPIKHEIRQWFHDKVQTKSLDITAASAWFEHNQVDEFSKHLYVEAVANSIHYRFADAFKPVYAPQCALRFFNNTLAIHPKQAEFYAMQSNATWLDINFNDFMLYLYLRIPEAKLTHDIQSLIQSYGIHIPLIQTSGVAHSNLDLNISLDHPSTTAQGLFHINDSDILIADELPLHINEATIKLHNAAITIDSSDINYLDILNATSRGSIDFSTSLGHISSILNTFTIKRDNKPFIQALHPVALQYTLTPNSENIQSQAIELTINSNKNLHIDEMLINSRIAKGYFESTPTYFAFSDMADGYIGFEYNASSQTLQSAIDLLSFQLNDLNLNQSTLNIHAYYHDTLTLNTPSSSKWRFNTQQFVIAPTSVELLNDHIIQKRSTIIVENLLSLDFKSNIDIKRDSGDLILKNIKVADSKLGSLFSRKKQLHVNYANRASKTYLNIAELNTNVELADKQWRVKVSSLAPFASELTMLHDFNITDGSLDLSGDVQSSAVVLDANITESYGFLFEDGNIAHTHQIQATYDNALILAQINKHPVRINTQSSEFNASNVQINALAINQYLDEHKGSQKSAKKSVLNCTACQIRINKNRAILADNIQFFALPKSSAGKLTYHEGTILFHQKGDDLAITGENLDDAFMNAIYSDSNFLNGRMSFEIHSTNHNNYLGTLHIEKSYLKEQRLLNNIFAFVNTLPALTSFSLPSFSTKGLYVNSMDANFYYKEQTLFINTFTLNAKDLDVLANGEIKLKEELIDLNINIITDIGSNFSKIPVVGYIIMGKDGRVQTSMTMKGALENPQIKTTLAREIIDVPFNIIKRTLTFPFELFK